MEKIYIPGMSVTREELQKITDLFRSQKMPVVPFTNEYLFLSKMSKNNIRKLIMERIDFICHRHDGVHLICHSMGCNLGVIASSHPCVESLTLISPEFGSTTRLEKKEILERTSQKYQQEQIETFPTRSLGEQLLLVGLFLRSRSWALKELSHIDVPIRVYYSEGDPFVSREEIRKIGDFTTKKIMVETSNHNPLLSEKGPELVKMIKRYYGE
ncbi:MAG: hypothetical protein HFH08_03425 [Bacilli bacterium]|nr:hypothetical protein [Bacilli bacterium]